MTIPSGSSWDRQSRRRVLADAIQIECATGYRIDSGSDFQTVLVKGSTWNQTKKIIRVDEFGGISKEILARGPLNTLASAGATAVEAVGSSAVVVITLLVVLAMIFIGILTT